MDPDPRAIAGKIVACCDDALIVTGEHGLVAHASEAAGRLLGCSPGSLVGRQVFDVLSECFKFTKKSMLSLVSGLATPLVNGETVARMMVRINEESLLSVNATGIGRTVDEQLANTFLAFKTVAADKKTESLYWESLERVWETQRLSEDILRSIPVAIFICKAVKRGKITVLDCNLAAENMTHLSLDQIQGMDLGSFWTEAREAPQTIMNAVLDGGTIFDEELQFHQDGKLKRAYTVQAFPVSGERLGVVFEDITRKQEENIRLKELDELRNNFIAITSHELKTPLVSTCGAAEFLLSHFKDRLGKEEYGLVDLINRGATRLKFLINSLLDLSRLQAGKLNIEPAVADLPAIVTRVIEDQQYRLDTRSQAVHYEGTASFSFTFDPLRIEQVVTNLLTNAMKNTPRGGQVTITVDPREHEGIVRCSVSDPGIGLEPDEKKALFQQFGKINREGLDADVDIQGTGLGLYISKEIVDLHGGCIWAESEGRGKGAVFTFELPVNQ